LIQVAVDMMTLQIDTAERWGVGTMGCRATDRAVAVVRGRKRQKTLVVADHAEEQKSPTTGQQLLY
jgi:hypothetical protein